MIKYNIKLDFHVIMLYIKNVQINVTVDRTYPGHRAILLTGRDRPFRNPERDRSKNYAFNPIRLYF